MLEEKYNVRQIPKGQVDVCTCYQRIREGFSEGVALFHGDLK